MRKTAALLAASLTVAQPAFAQEGKPTKKETERTTFEEVLDQDNPALNAILEVVIAQLMKLGWKNIRRDQLHGRIVRGRKPEEIIIKDIPRDRVHDMIQAINYAATEKRLPCVPFVIVPKTDKQPGEYDGPFDMGVDCGIATNN